MTLSFKRYSALFMTYLKVQWRRVCLLFVLLFTGLGLSLVNPLILQKFIDTASTGNQSSSLLLIAVWFLVVATLRQGVAVADTYVAENISLTTTNRLRADLMLHCLLLDSAFHTKHTPGELIERVDGDVSLLGNFFSRFVGALLGNALLMLGVLVMLYHIDWRVGAVITLFVVISLLILASFRNLAAPHWEKVRQASAELFGFLEERLSSTEDIRSSGAVTYMIYGLAALSRNLLRRNVVALQISFSTWGSTIILFAIGTAISLAMGIYLFSLHAITIGTVYLIYSFVTLLNDPIEQIIQQVRDLQQVSGSLNRVLGLLDIQGTIEDGEGAELPAGPLPVALRDVSFQYVEDVPVLKHIQLELQPGQVLGLLGRTGSGKSTLTRLLVRLYDPLAGQVELGGNDVRKLRLDDLRSRVGMVTQDVHILHTTVRNNLTLFDPAIPDQKIIDALEDLGLGSWFQALPDGLNTKLAPGGTGLSAGEAQLFAFARVFLKDPGLVILDEASSRLDPVTERLLEHAIDKLLAGRTGIIIAHRLATVQRAHSIMILENGVCCEYGPRESLASDPESRFASLLRVGLEEVLA